MTGNDVVPEVLWTPTPERMARAAITDFTEFVADRTGRAFTDYAARMTDRDAYRRAQEIDGKLIAEIQAKQAKESENA